MEGVTSFHHCGVLYTTFQKVTTKKRRNIRFVRSRWSVCVWASATNCLTSDICFNQVKISPEQGSETRSKDIKGVVFGAFFFRTKSKSMFFQLKLYPSVKMRTLSWNEPDLRRHVHFNESARSMCSKHQDKTKKLVFVWWLPKRLFFLPVTCFYRLLFQKRCLLFFF